MAYEPSPQQQAYFDFLKAKEGSLVLQASAGAGKSTTLIEGLKYMRGSVFMGAFNKKIAVELQEKAEKAGVMRRGIFISTLHSAGFGAWRRVHSGVRTDSGKVLTLLDQWVKKNAMSADLVGYVQGMVSLAKQTMCGVDWDVGDTARWVELSEHFGLDQDIVGTVDNAVWLCKKAFITSSELCPLVIDFDDMIWAPLAFNTRFYQNDWVLVDEAQDTNASRREMLFRMLKPGGRLVAVGDARQAIYGFTGSDSDAMNLIRDKFQCSTLPLSVTYRCPKAVVAHAHKYVPEDHITAHDFAPQGLVRPVFQITPRLGSSRNPWYVDDEPRPTDAVICRYTKPLVKTAYGMLRANMACKVEGRDIGKGLVALVRKYRADTLDALEEKLDAWLTKQVTKARAKGSDAAEQSALDRRETIQIFIDRCQDKGKDHPSCVIAEITDLFADDVAGVITLCTGHKSKGREWLKVYWLESSDYERPGTQDWMRDQERNLSYVIATRAMAELVLVSTSVQRG